MSHQNLVTGLMLAELHGVLRDTLTTYANVLGKRDYKVVTKIDCADL